MMIHTINEMSVLNINNYTFKMKKLKLKQLTYFIHIG